MSAVFKTLVAGRNKLKKMFEALQRKQRPQIVGVRV